MINKLIAVIFGSAILANNKSSLINSPSTFRSHRLSALPSTAEMSFRYHTDLLYASNLTSGNANVTAGPYVTVTNSVVPLINAKGSSSWLDSNQSIGACLLHDVARLLHFPLSSPVPKRFCCKRYWIRVYLRSPILVQKSQDRFRSNFLPFSIICLGKRVKFINPPKFPCVIAISVRSQSIRRFCIPSASKTAGSFTKFCAPNVTNNASISSIDNSVTALRNSVVR